MKRVILVGCAASGKDYARKVLQDFGLEYQVGHTTRPPREGEVHERDYFFLSDDKFAEMTVEGLWYEYVSFNGWYYGTTKEQFNTEGSVFIMTPSGLSHLKKEDREESFVIYFNIQEDIRRSRLLKRDDGNDQIERRLAADKKDFEGFKDFDVQIVNPIFDAPGLAGEVLKILKL